MEYDVIKLCELWVEFIYNYIKKILAQKLFNIYKFYHFHFFRGFDGLSLSLEEIKDAFDTAKSDSIRLKLSKVKVLIVIKYSNYQHFSFLLL